MQEVVQTELTCFCLPGLGDDTNQMLLIEERNGEYREVQDGGDICTTMADSC